MIGAFELFAIACLSMGLSEVLTALCMGRRAREQEDMRRLIERVTSASTTQAERTPMPIDVVSVQVHGCTEEGCCAICL